MSKKILLDKINGTKNVVFLFSQASTHRSSTFNLRFLYELKHKVCLSETVWDFPFWIMFIFIKLYISVIIPFKIKIKEKPQTVLLSSPWFLSYNKKLQLLKIQ